MKKTLILVTCIYSTIQLMAQNDLQKVRQGAREVKNTAREVKLATKETKAMANEFRGSGEKEAASPAKSYIKKFWEYVEKMEAAPTDLNILGTNSRAAATTINNIKVKDKNYDVGPLERELQKWQQAYNNAKNGGVSQRGANNDVASLIKLLYQVNTNVSQQELEGKLQEIEQYKIKTEELVALNLDPADKTNAALIGNVKSRLKVDLQTIDSNVKLWETNMNMIIDERPARAYFAMIQFEHAHWDALRKGPFTEKDQFEAGYQKVTEMLKRIGSLDEVLAKGKARGVELVKNTKMPPAITQNAEIEGIFRQSFEDTGWNETIVKINLLDRDWKAIRNEVTGLLEGRSIRAAIAVKRPQGGYTLYNYFTIKQDFLGSTYSKQAYIIYKEGSEILLENIN